MCYCFAVSDFLAGTAVINNVSDCSCCEIACCCEYISSLPAGAAVKVQALLITLKAMKGKKGKILPGNVFHVNPMNLDNMLSSGTQQCTGLENGFGYPFLCSNPFPLLLPLRKVLISYRKELWPFQSEQAMMLSHSYLWRDQPCKFQTALPCRQMLLVVTTWLSTNSFPQGCWNGSLEISGSLLSPSRWGLNAEVRVNTIYDAGISCAAHKILQIYLKYLREQFYIKNFHL